MLKLVVTSRGSSPGTVKYPCRKGRGSVSRRMLYDVSVSRVGLNTILVNRFR
jgi:hypothetical protein